MTVLHLVVPEGIDDPTRPSGGNVYDRRVSAGLSTLGWNVHEHVVPGSWPEADDASRRTLTAVMRGVDDDALVLIDGLIASAAADQLLPQSRRVRQVVLMHMPLGRDRGEESVVRGARAVVATSDWTRRLLMDAYAVGPPHVHVVEPGVARAEQASGSDTGGQLLSVGAVVPHKGHDILLAALGMLADHRWTCMIVGSLDRDAAFAAALQEQARATGLADRVAFAGTRAGDDLDAAYASADVLVLPSRAETYGMVVTEALARGLPVIGSDVGGVPSALGATADGARPGILVPSQDPHALAAALRAWLDDGTLRRRLCLVARERRASLAGWDEAAGRLDRVLREVAA